MAIKNADNVEKGYFSYSTTLTMDIFGNFYFEMLSSGILTGEYFDNTRLMMEPESARPLITNQGLIGEYSSTWDEEGESHEATLIIGQGQRPWLYLLEWRQKGKIVYRGNGYIRDGKLNGHYWKTNK